MKSSEPGDAGATISNSNNGRRRLRYSLSALFALTTAVAVVIAGMMSWQVRTRVGELAAMFFPLALIPWWWAASWLGRSIVGQVALGVVAAGGIVFCAFWGLMLAHQPNGYAPTEWDYVPAVFVGTAAGIAVWHVVPGRLED
jgi:hypothetical protein